MNVITITPPTTEPVSLADVKDYLRVTGTEEDALIGGLISAARSMIEERVGRALAVQTLQLVLDKFPSNEIRIPRPPLRSVSLVQYYDTAGTLQTLDEGLYTVITTGLSGSIYAEAGWPEVQDRPAAVMVTYECGYSDAGADGDVPTPPSLAMAVKYLASHFYEHRQPVEVGTIATPMPLSVEALTSGHRVSPLTYDRNNK